MSVYNPTDLNPAMAYGVQLAQISNVQTSTTIGADVNSGMSTNARAGDHLSLHWDNPLFWLLVLLLLFVGYVGFLFDFSVKRIGSVELKGGKG